MYHSDHRISKHRERKEVLYPALSKVSTAKLQKVSKWRSNEQTKAQHEAIFDRFQFLSINTSA